MTNLHPLDKAFMMRKTGVWWTPDKSADDDGIPVNDVIVSVSLHWKLQECVGQNTVRVGESLMILC